MPPAQLTKLGLQHQAGRLAHSQSVPKAYIRLLVGAESHNQTTAMALKSCRIWLPVPLFPLLRPITTQLHHFLGKALPEPPALATPGPAPLLLHISHLELHLNFMISILLLNSAIKFTGQSLKNTLENSTGSMLCTYPPGNTLEISLLLPGMQQLNQRSSTHYHLQFPTGLFFLT